MVCWPVQTGVEESHQKLFANDSGPRRAETVTLRRSVRRQLLTWLERVVNGEGDVEAVALAAGEERSFRHEAGLRMAIDGVRCGRGGAQ